MSDVHDETSIAGPSSTPTPHTPECMHTDIPSAADGARRRLLPKGSFLAGLLPTRHRPNFSSRKPLYDQAPAPDSQHEHEDQSPPTSAEYEEQLVQLEQGLSEAELEENYNKDVYRWAILFENQRGVTVFSTPYYSPLSLLPMDPPSFTIPSTTKTTKAGQPTVSLSSYPLPDGTWRWVSRSWMVDMRGDGQTQYDGFEYNWFFRSKNWRSEVGHLSSGGWVRRRRWVRLMMRPAQTARAELSDGQDAGSPAPQYADNGATRPPSVVTVVDSTMGDGEVWDGDDDENWLRCKIALKRVGRDGRKLELWKAWLGRPSSKSSSPSPSTSDLGREEGPLSAVSEALISVVPAPRERVAAVLRHHGSEILQSFVYPESRAQFIDLVAETGLLLELQTNPEEPGPLAMLDFWSYANSLERLSQQEDTSSSTV